MKKKHQLATWTVGVTLFASLSPAFALADGNTAVPVVQTAETGLSQQQALDLVKKLFLIDDSYKLTHVGRNESGNTPNYAQYGGAMPIAFDTWDFNFTKGDGANAANIYVSVNAKTGTIRNFGLYYNQGVESDSSDSISADSSKQIALSWIAKLAPDQAKLLDEGKDMYQNGFKPNNNSTSFRFNRLVNGIPFQNDGVNITISNHGDLLNYNMNWTWDDSKFPSATAAITQDQAVKTFASLPLSLHYVQQWMPYADGPTVQLIYSSLNSYGYNGPLPVVDAVYGTLVDGAGKPVSASVYTLNPIATTPGAPLTTSPISDKDTAAAFAKKLLNLDDSYTLTNSNYNAPGDSGTGPKTWNLSFAKSSSTSTPDKPSMINISVTINADTGELMNYWNNNAPATSTTNTGASTLTWDQAVQKAKDFLMKVAPTQVSNLALQAANPIYGGKFPNAYMVNFTRLVNGIPFDYSNVNVSVNQNTGEILNYNGYFNNQNLTYPDPAKAISLQNAQAAFASHYKMQLQYVMQPGDPANGDQPATNPMLKLVYAPINSDNTFNNEVLDAISGQFISLNGQPVHHDVLDIKDHWAAKQLQDFADRGLIELKDGKVTPDQQLTRAKALHLLLLAVRTPYYYKAGAASSSTSAANDIAAAKAAGWIDKDMTDFRPNDFLTREELADFAAHVMGYGKLASKPNIFKNLYTDISNNDNYLGDIAIVSALGVMKGESQDTFSPSEKVTLAQAVVVADRIVKLQGNGPIYRPY